VESALEHAGEVTNKRYREALQQQRDQVMMSKKLAAIETNVPLELDLLSLQVREPDAAALAVLYRELGFNSLLKELLASGTAEPSVEAGAETHGPPGASGEQAKDYLQFQGADEFREFLKKLAAKQFTGSLAEPGSRRTRSGGIWDARSGIEVSSKTVKDEPCGWTKKARC